MKSNYKIYILHIKQTLKVKVSEEIIAFQKPSMIHAQTLWNPLSGRNAGKVFIWTFNASIACTNNTQCLYISA